MRSAIASPPCQATPGRARPSAPGCWRASARSSQGASVFSAPSIVRPRARRHDELGPDARNEHEPQAARPRRAPQPHLHRSAAQEHRALALHGRQTMRRAGRADHRAARGSRGGAVLARPQRRARLGRHARRARARDLARDGHDAGRRYPRPRRGDRPAARGRRRRRRDRDGRRPARRARLADPAVRDPARARHPHERRRLRSAGAVLVREHGLRRARGRGLALPRRGRRELRDGAHRRHDLERPRLVARRRDGVLRRLDGRRDRQLRVRRRERRARRAAPVRRGRVGPRPARRHRGRRRGRRVGRALGGRRGAPLRARRDARRRRPAALRSGHGLRVRRRRPLDELFITTSRLELPDGVDPAGGSLFRCEPGVRGQAVLEFAG